MNPTTPAGLLWWDNRPGSLADKIQAAAQCFAAKYGVRPDLACVNMADLPEGGELPQVEGLRVMPAKIGRHYVLVGITDESGKL